jgi:hypothetical protein
MHLIGCDKYPWKGVGINLVETRKKGNTQPPQRLMEEQEAYILCDKIIRRNYFANPENQ